MLRKEAQKVLLGSGWLSRMPEDFQRAVLRRALPECYAEGRHVFRMGDAPGGIYGLVRGALAITSAPADAMPRLMHMARPGGWTGEASYLTRQPRLIEVQAKAPTVMIHLPLEQMDAMTFHDPRVSRYFAMILLQTAQVLAHVAHDLQILDPARRIAATIERTASPVSRELPITQTELGEMSCTTRRQVSIALKTFSTQGWVVAHYRKITILDAAALHAFARAD